MHCTSLIVMAMNFFQIKIDAHIYLTCIKVLVKLIIISSHMRLCDFLYLYIAQAYEDNTSIHGRYILTHKNFNPHYIDN